MHDFLLLGFRVLHIWLWHDVIILKLVDGCEITQKLVIIISLFLTVVAEGGINL